MHLWCQLLWLGNILHMNEKKSICVHRYVSAVSSCEHCRMIGGIQGRCVSYVPGLCAYTAWMLSFRLEMEVQEEVGEWKWSAEHQDANSPKSSPPDKETSGFWWLSDQCPPWKPLHRSMWGPSQGRRYSPWPPGWWMDGLNQTIVTLLSWDEWKLTNWNLLILSFCLTNGESP